MLSDLHELIDEYRADVALLTRYHALAVSESRLSRLDRLFEEWQRQVDDLDSRELGGNAKVDRLLFANHLAYRRRQVAIERERQAAILDILPFATRIIELEEARVRMEGLDPRRAAEALAAVADEVTQSGDALPEHAESPYLHLATEATKELQEALERWFKFYDGYDPSFNWWVQHPYAEASEALQSLRSQLEEMQKGKITGHPVGREALLTDLEFEMIPYSPEELIALGEREYAWCENEMKRAASELGFGEDWRAAVEHVKTLHLPPGQQPQLVRDLAFEAIRFLEDHDLLTIPELAKESWRMEMMSPERQLVSPFFLGGETIIVSYPTHTMTHAQKLMSMRGNNPHFSRATVQHELIPGHHMQFFMLQRHRPYREVFGTPFWIEGWALYWEMRLWDLDFPQGPEDRIGMLFWRMHRCVRIVFSLGFHLGQLTPEQCVDMLVERVGHERANAEGEVRRSFNGSYPPLYQAAYMIGGLQFRALWRELVESGPMSDREFHDAILKENEMPVAVLRHVLRGDAIPDEGIPTWRFEEV